MNILFTCAGRRNYLLEFFKKEVENSGLIVATDMQKSAPSMAVADKSFIVPAIYHPNYIDTLLKICSKERIDVIISLNDLELPLLAENKEIFLSIGTKVFVSDKRVIDICFDKLKTAEFINSLNFNTPKTFLSLQNAIQAIKNDSIKFPLVVKPRWGSASIGIDFPESIEELKLSYQLLILKLRRTILAKVSEEDYNNAIIIQEKLLGTEYGIDIINDINTNNVTTIVKKKIAMRAGETDKAMTVDNPEIKKIGNKIGSALGHIGNLDCDIFEKENKYYILELNPRFGGGYPFSHMAGANIPKAIITWLKGETPNSNCFKVNYNMAFSKCDKLIKIETD